MLSITVDNTAWNRHLTDVERNQIPFATSQALNQAAIDFQGAERRHMHDIFTERRPDWLDRSVKITHFAKKTELYATIGIHPPGGDSRADILAKFEDQTEKTPFRGHNVAIPTSFIKRNKQDIVSKNLFPSKLNLHKDGNRIIGDQRTFVVKTAGGRSIILQRIGHGKRSMTQAIWLLVPFARISPDLEFEANARKIVELSWSVNFDAALTKALASAR